MYNQKFMQAYFEDFADNGHLNCCWRRYLTLVYINARGNIKGCNLMQIRRKFKTLHIQPSFEKTLYKLAAAAISYENPDNMQFYWELLKHKERFLNRSKTIQIH